MFFMCLLVSFITSECIFPEHRTIGLFRDRDIQTLYTTRNNVVAWLPTYSAPFGAKKLCSPIILPFNFLRWKILVES